AEADVAMVEDDAAAAIDEKRAALLPAIALDRGVLVALAERARHVDERAKADRGPGRTDQVGCAEDAERRIGDDLAGLVVGRVALDERVDHRRRAVADEHGAQSRVAQLAEPRRELRDLLRATDAAEMPQEQEKRGPVLPERSDPLLA